MSGIFDPVPFGVDVEGRVVELLLGARPARRPMMGGKTWALVVALAAAAATSPERVAYVTADAAFAELLRRELGDLADVHHREHAPRGVVLQYPADEVPAFPRPRPRGLGFELDRVIVDELLGDESR